MPILKKKTSAKKPETTTTTISPFLRISTQERISFFKYMAVMTDAGAPLEKSLGAVLKQTQSGSMKKVVAIMIADVQSGEFLSTSMKKMPHIFDPLSVSLVVVAENSGTLTKTFFLITQNLEKNQKLHATVRSAMVYPVIVIITTLAVTGYLVFGLMPQIMPVFISLRVTLPLSTRLVIGFSEFILKDGLWALLGVALAYLAIYFLLKIRAVKYRLHAIALYIPIFGQLVQNIQIAQFARTMGTLLSSGVTIVSAITMAGEASGNLVYRDLLMNIAKSVQEGSSISDYLLKNKTILPPFIEQMISVGEEAGKLSESFTYIAEFAEHEVDETSKNLTTVLEPFLMIVVGGLVGFIAIAILTPVYELTGSIHT